MIKALIMILFVSCSSHTIKKDNLKSASEIKFRYKDSSGDYYLIRSRAISKKKLVTRNVLIDLNTNTQMERTSAVSSFGQSKKNEQALLLPTKSQYIVWFDKQKYTSNINVDIKKKSYLVEMRSPEKQWQGVKEFKVGKANKLCWYSQLSECLRILGFTDNKKEKHFFHVLWDSFPYHTEQIEGMRNTELVVPASLTYDGKHMGYDRFELILDGQMLTFFYDSNGKFKKFFWVAQGIAMEQMGK